MASDSSTAPAPLEVVSIAPGTTHREYAADALASWDKPELEATATALSHTDGPSLGRDQTALLESRASGRSLDDIAEHRTGTRNAVRLSAAQGAASAFQTFGYDWQNSGPKAPNSVLLHLHEQTPSGELLMYERVRGATFENDGQIALALTDAEDQATKKPKTPEQMQLLANASLTELAGQLESAGITQLALRADGMNDTTFGQALIDAARKRGSSTLTEQGYEAFSVADLRESAAQPLEAAMLPNRFSEGFANAEARSPRENAAEFRREIPGETREGATQRRFEAATAYLKDKLGDLDMVPLPTKAAPGFDSAPMNQHAWNVRMENGEHIEVRLQDDSSIMLSEVAESLDQLNKDMKTHPDVPVTRISYGSRYLDGVDNVGLANLASSEIMVGSKHMTEPRGAENKFRRAVGDAIVTKGLETAYPNAAFRRLANASWTVGHSATGTTKQNFGYLAQQFYESVDPQGASKTQTEAIQAAGGRIGEPAYFEDHVGVVQEDGSIQRTSMVERIPGRTLRAIERKVSPEAAFQPQAVFAELYARSQSRLLTNGATRAFSRNLLNVRDEYRQRNGLAALR